MSRASHQSGLGTKWDSDSSATTSLYFLVRKKTRTDDERCKKKGTAVESCCSWHKSHVNRHGLSRMSSVSAAGTREEMGTTKRGSRRMSEYVYSYRLHQATGSQT